MLILTFIFGLIIGSFLNVLIYRIPRLESVVWPGSHCPSCGHQLAVSDLVPLVSFLWLKGKCRYCTAEISPLYPLVEIITATVFTLIVFKGGLTIWTAAGLILAVILITVAFTDITEGIIPDVITYPGLTVGIVLSFFTIGIKSALLGTASFALVFLFITVVSKGGMGGGDIKLAAVIGAFLGPGASVMVFTFSSLIAFIGVIPCLIFKKAGRKTMIKFGPFLASAAFIVYVYGEEILKMYWSLWGF